jgi:ferredoxin
MAIKTERTDRAAEPRIDKALCTTCGSCVNVCPTGTLQMGADGVWVEPDTDFGCIGCGLCMAICPSGAATVSGRCLSPDDRLPLPPADALPSAEQLSALLTRRRSQRYWQEREVPRDVLQQVIEMTATAPMGIPPSDVRLTVFQGRDKVRELAAEIVGVMRKGLPTLRRMAGPLMRPLLGRSTSEFFRSFLVPLSDGIIRDHEQGRDSLFYDAPAAILFSQPQYAEADAHISATYSMLAAESLGLGTCMIGSASPFLARAKPLLSKYGLPPKPKLGLVLVMGYVKYHKFHYGLRRSLAGVDWA